MATLNLLNGSFNGKMGSVYGTRQYRKHFAKAIPFSHAPHSATQTDCVRAFEVLNRISATVARNFAQSLPISYSKMSKMNAVAKLFKPTIKTHSFSVANLSDVFIVDPNFYITAILFDHALHTVTFTVINTFDNNYYDKANCFFVLYDRYGNCVSSLSQDNAEGTYTLYYENISGGVLTLLAIRTLQRGSRKVCNGLSYLDTVVSPIIGTTLYCSYINNGEDFALLNSTLSIPIAQFDAPDDGLILLHTQ